MRLQSTLGQPGSRWAGSSPRANGRGLIRVRGISSFTTQSVGRSAKDLPTLCRPRVGRYDPRDRRTRTRPVAEATAIPPRTHSNHDCTGDEPSSTAGMRRINNAAETARPTMKPTNA